MSYTRNFGIRSFENIVRNGRFRAPATGTPLVIGSPVVINAASPGFLKQAADGQAPANGGVVVFEHIQSFSGPLVEHMDAPFTDVPLGQYAQIVHGAGVKVWIKKTSDKTLYDGRTQTGYDPFDATVNLGSLAIGAQLVPAASGKWRVADAGDMNGTPPVLPEAGWLTVEQINATAGLVEARFNF